MNLLGDVFMEKTAEKQNAPMRKSEQIEILINTACVSRIAEALERIADSLMESREIE